MLRKSAWVNARALKLCVSYRKDLACKFGEVTEKVPASAGCSVTDVLYNLQKDTGKIDEISLQIL